MGPDLVDLPAAHSERRGGAVEGPPTGLFSARAPGSGADGELAEPVSTRKPGPAEKSPGGEEPERQDPDASGAPPRLETTGPRRERCAASLGRVSRAQPILP